MVENREVVGCETKRASFSDNSEVIDNKLSGCCTVQHSV
jgi:hypothetical protein